MCEKKQCCPVSSVQRHVPREHGITWSMFQGTWCKPRDTMHLRWFFGPTAVSGRSIRILCCCVMDDDINLLHLFRDIIEILTVSLGQHWKITPSGCSMFPEGQCTTLGHYFSMLTKANDQYLYIITGAYSRRRSLHVASSFLLAELSTASETDILALSHAHDVAQTSTSLRQLGYSLPNVSCCKDLFHNAENNPHNWLISMPVLVTKQRSDVSEPLFRT